MTYPQQKPHHKFEHFLIEKKEAILAALYKNEHDTAQTLLCQINSAAQKRTRLTENQEKLINQILLMFKKLNADTDTCYRHLRKKILFQIKSESRRPSHISFDSWFKALGIGTKQANLLFKSAMTFQLSCGCSNFCRRCNEWALPKIRSHFSFNAVKTILSRMAQQQNYDISLYGASDPLDWAHHDKNITDIIRYADGLCVNYSLLTKVPRGKSDILKVCFNMDANISVSQTRRNKKRIQTVEKSLGYTVSKQHDTDDLLIPAGLDEDFVSVNPSITDGYGTEITPDGAYIIIPTFTSALHPYGHQKLRITKKTSIFPVKRTGRDALLVDYFKPLESHDINGKKFWLKTLLFVQVESILLDNGGDDLTPPGMRSLKEYFSIFDESARSQRKKMTLSVVRKLKQKYLNHYSYRNLRPAQKEEYRKKLSAHFYLCSLKGCNQSRQSAVSFFLLAVQDYVKQNTAKIQIIRYLLKNEIAQRLKDPGQIDAAVNRLASDSLEDAFDIFRILALHLLTASPPLASVRNFIKTCPAIYDPVSDLFCMAPES